MKKNIISERLERLREVLRREHFAAFIFPSGDPHNSEYTAEHWKGREWISGFNGSAGTAVVTPDSAALWTDSRYFLAAEEQLKGTEFQLMRLKMKDTPTIAQWIREQCDRNGTDSTEVGIDGWCSTANSVKELAAELRKNGGMTLRTNMDPLSLIWSDRPPIPEAPIVLHPLEYAGERTREKIARIRQALRKRHADGMLMGALDDIAWTLNLRGSDIHCNPVFVSYLLISTQDVTLYVNPRKLTADVTAYLREEGVKTDRYENIGKGLKEYFEYNILMDPDEVNDMLYQATTRERIAEESPVKGMKAVKNTTEADGFRRAMTRDGIAMVKFLKWLKPAVQAGGQTEISVADKLEAYRAEQPLYRGLSFDTIAGYQEHGAIVHYEATPDTDSTLRPEGLLLLDSGAQYLDGTTDITRTIALGPLTEEQRRVYTLVLKGHIQLQMTIFPDGASGTQLDAIARRPLWQAGMNFLHGTGHGVGSYLNVHEGPHQIRMEWKPAPLHTGMTVTDEPGIYIAGKFGVRTENTLLITPAMETEAGKFLKFETLTLCPVDTTPVITDMMTQEETDWLNEYHRTVYEKLSPYLTEEEKEWLAGACKPLSYNK